MIQFVYLGEQMYMMFGCPWKNIKNRYISTKNKQRGKNRGFWPVIDSRLQMFCGFIRDENGK